MGTFKYRWAQHNFCSPLGSLPHSKSQQTERSTRKLSLTSIDSHRSKKKKKDVQGSLKAGLYPAGKAPCWKKNNKKESVMHWDGPAVFQHCRNFCCKDTVKVVLAFKVCHTSSKANAKRSSGLKIRREHFSHRLCSALINRWVLQGLFQHQRAAWEAD